jgi:hypothetical protein
VKGESEKESEKKEIIGKSFFHPGEILGEL